MEEVGDEAVEFAVAMDGLAVIVNERNPLQEIPPAWQGKARTWSDLQVIP